MCTGMCFNFLRSRDGPWLHIRGRVGQWKEPRCQEGYIPLQAPPLTVMQPWETHIFSDLPFPYVISNNIQKSYKKIGLKELCNWKVECNCEGLVIVLSWSSSCIMKSTLIR